MATGIPSDTPGSDGPEHLEAVARFSDGLTLASLPKEVVDRARLVVLDTLGAVVAGMCAAPLTRLAATLGSGAVGAASVPSLEEGLPASMAAFVNGTAGTWNELDEGNFTTHGHPAVHVVPAALALAEEMGSGGDELLTAVIAGYEVGGRVGRSTTFRDAVMHPHGTHGTIGGALACGLLLGLRGSQIGGLINVASSMTVATSRPTVFQGATVRNSYSGQAGQNAVLAARMTAAGVTGERDGLASVFGHVSGEAFDAADFVSGLGTDFIILGNYFKAHACCAYSHATLDALRKAIAGRWPDWREVESVEVTTYYPATRMKHTNVDNELASKFSLPYAVAALLVRRECGVDAFIEPALSDPAIRSLMPRVVIHEDAAATAAYPGAAKSLVCLRLRDGSRLEASVDSADPLSPATVHEKFAEVASPMLGSDGARRVIELVDGLGRGVNARDLGRSLRRTIA